MPMGYDPREKVDGGGDRAEPGEYHFRVEAATEKPFRSGNEGCEVKLAVAAFRDRDIPVRDWFVYAPNALWKLEQFFTAIGHDFGRPPEAYQLVGCAGKARFKHNENGYLVVAEYLPMQQAPPQQQRGSHVPGGYRQAPPQDNVPF